MSKVVSQKTPACRRGREDRGQKTEDRRQKSEVRKLKGENRVQTIFCFLFSVFYFLFSIFCSLSYSQTPDSEQQIDDFSLSGFGEKGKKTWAIEGKSAQIYSDIVKLKDITGNLYGETDNVKLTAEKGDFNKQEGKVHLQENVVITTSSGAKLTTDSLDWDRKNNLVTTKDYVNIEKDNLITTSTGATGRPGLNQVDLEKDVKLQILPVEEKDGRGDTNKEKITITCEGPLSIDYEKNLATFNNNVKVDRADSQIYSDRMEIYFVNGQAEEKPDKGPAVINSRIDKIVALGNVKIVRGENISYSEEAVYNAADKKIVLSGKPKLVIYSAEEMNASFGN